MDTTRFITYNDLCNLNASSNDVIKIVSTPLKWRTNDVLKQIDKRTQSQVYIDEDSEDTESKKTKNT